MEAQYKVNAVDLVVYRTPPMADVQDHWSDPETVQLTWSDSEHVVMWPYPGGDGHAPLVRIALAGVHYPDLSGVRLTLAFEDKARMGAFLAMLNAMTRYELSQEQDDMFLQFWANVQNMYESVPDQAMNEDS